MEQIQTALMEPVIGKITKMIIMMKMVIIKNLANLMKKEAIHTKLYCIEL
jgi:hypothetical protein